MGQGWYMGGPGLERGLERNGTLQHSTAIKAHAHQIRSMEQKASRRLPAGSSQAHLYTIKQHGGATAGSKCEWYRCRPATGLRRREAHKQSILRLPAGSGQAHPYQHTK